VTDASATARPPEAESEPQCSPLPASTVTSPKPRPGRATIRCAGAHTTPVFLFEPHQPEQCDWKPNVLLDVTPVWESKRAAIEWMAGQEHLWEYYTRVALQRGAQAARNSDKKITYGEGYEAVFPHVVENLS